MATKKTVQTPDYSQTMTTFVETGPLGDWDQQLHTFLRDAIMIASRTGSRMLWILQHSENEQEREKALSEILDWIKHPRFGKVDSIVLSRGLRAAQLALCGIDGDQHRQLMLVASVAHAANDKQVNMFVQSKVLDSAVAAGIEARSRFARRFPGRSRKMTTARVLELFVESAQLWNNKSPHAKADSGVGAGKRARSKWKALSELILELNIGNVSPKSISVLCGNNKSLLVEWMEMP